MKKIFLLVAALLIIAPSPAFAASWVWVTSNSECTLYIDSYYIGVSKSQYGNVTYLECYAKYEYLEEDDDGMKSSIQKTKFRVQDNPFTLSNVQISVTSATSYDSNHRVIKSYSQPYEIWDDVLPDTFAEGLYFAAWKCYADKIGITNNRNSGTRRPITGRKIPR